MGGLFSKPDSTCSCPSYAPQSSIKNSCGPTPRPYSPSPIPLLRGSKIRISQPTMGCFNVSKFQIFISERDFRENRVYDTGGNLSSSSNHVDNPGYGINNLRTIWNGTPIPLQFHAHNNCQDAGWFEWTFPNDIPIYAIRIINRQDCCTTRMNGVRLTIQNSQNQEMYRSEPFFDDLCSTTFENKGHSALSNIQWFTLFPPDTRPYSLFSVSCNNNN